MGILNLLNTKYKLTNIWYNIINKQKVETMSKTTDWIIAKQQEQADTAYMEECPQPTEQEQLQIDLDNFNHSADQIENSIDNYLNKQSQNQEWEVDDSAYENHVDNCLSWGEDYR